MEKGLDFLDLKKCLNCGKEFSVLYPHLYRYKVRYGGEGHYHYFCSWGCLRANEQNKERNDMEKMKKDGTPAKKPGRNPKTVEAVNEQVDEKLMAAVSVNGKIKILTDEPEDVSVVCTGDTYTGDPEKEPTVREQLVTTAVKHPDLGEFYYHQKYETIDWLTLEDDEVSLSPYWWKRLISDLPEILKVLGVDPE